MSRDDKSTSHTSAPAAGGRLISLDALRGFIMILMAIDHASFLVSKIHFNEFWGNPPPVHADALSFITRFVTHLCAPGFFFLMGSGMIMLAAARLKSGWSHGRLLRFFITRGLLLVLFQQVLENPAWIIGFMTADPEALSVGLPPPGGGGQLYVHLGVLFALGAAMILSAFMTRVSTLNLVTAGVLALAATQVIVPGSESVSIIFPAWLRITFVPGHSGWLNVLYPVVPWTGLTLLGMAYGRWLMTEREKAIGTALRIGLGCLAAFVLMRFAGGPVSTHPYSGGSWIDFLNVTKYPPSIVFVLLTMGLNFVALWIFDRTQPQIGSPGNPLMVFGRSPLFFYILHLYVFALMGLAFTGGSGYGLLYLSWLVGLGLLYYPCRWYGRFKQGKAVDSVWRLL